MASISAATKPNRERQKSGFVRTVLGRMMEAREREAQRYIALHYGAQSHPDLLPGEKGSFFDSRAPERH
ncbi:hypothetical protein [Jiella marina]|uniref:hypothetical protein n=1 Tax=Jiella sp. LLJ827 TaxID=2917712 RepID=UPI002101531A|nr:hypothetical protein [Jiella sp. LLJ827]MCQ0987481.1 hypothetical protein [Jiella sp. LLJ827]